jgi:hypothetical protein
LGEVERVEWQDGLGVSCTSLLIKPVGYEPSKRLSLPKTQSATKSGLFMQSVEGPKDLLNGRPLHI